MLRFIFVFWLSAHLCLCVPPPAPPRRLRTKVSLQSDGSATLQTKSSTDVDAFSAKLQAAGVKRAVARQISVETFQDTARRKEDVKRLVFNRLKKVGIKSSEAKRLLASDVLLPHVSTDTFSDISLVDVEAHSSFRLPTSVGVNATMIPRQVVLTGPVSTFMKLYRFRRSANLFNWLGLDKDLQVRYFNDSSCRDYIKRYYDTELVSFFATEVRGSYRGDLCRTAILAREGGFYVDLDMQLRVPLIQLVDDDTTFMTARSADLGALNALIAAVPGSPVLQATLEHMRKWYRNETKQSTPMGPVTMERGLQEVIHENCPQQNWTTSSVFRCGKEGVRLYSEVLLEHCAAWGSVMCPPARATRRWFGVQYGLFAAAKNEMKAFVPKAEQGAEKTKTEAFALVSKDRQSAEQLFIGWSRAQDCRNWGCRVSGGKRYVR